MAAFLASAARLQRVPSYVYFSASRVRLARCSRKWDKNDCLREPHQQINEFVPLEEGGWAQAAQKVRL